MSAALSIVFTGLCALAADGRGPSQVLLVDAKGVVPGMPAHAPTLVVDLRDLANPDTSAPTRVVLGPALGRRRSDPGRHMGPDGSRGARPRTRARPVESGAVPACRRRLVVAEPAEGRRRPAVVARRSLHPTDERPRLGGSDPPVAPRAPRRHARRLPTRRGRPRRHRRRAGGGRTAKREGLPRTGLRVPRRPRGAAAAAGHDRHRSLERRQSGRADRRRDHPRGGRVRETPRLRPSATPRRVFVSNLPADNGAGHEEHAHVVTDTSVMALHFGAYYELLEHAPADRPIPTLARVAPTRRATGMARPLICSPVLFDQR